MECLAHGHSWFFARPISSSCPWAVQFFRHPGAASDSAASAVRSSSGLAASNMGRRSPSSGKGMTRPTGEGTGSYIPRKILVKVKVGGGNENEEHM